MASGVDLVRSSIDDYTLPAIRKQLDLDGGSGNDELYGDIADELGAPWTGMDDIVRGGSGDDEVELRR
jgi:hypothetical protein